MIKKMMITGIRPDRYQGAMKTLHEPALLTPRENLPFQKTATYSQSNRSKADHFTVDNVT